VSCRGRRSTGAGGPNITKNGAGLVIFDARNHHAGSTTELRDNASPPLTKAITFTRGTISGSGTIGRQNGTLDPANVAVLVAEDGTGLDLVIVPEPAALVLAALGIGGGAVLSRRRRRSLQTAEATLTAA
jgi:autotransporter-associated beta strand protein